MDIIGWGPRHSAIEADCRSKGKRGCSRSQTVNSWLDLGHLSWQSSTHLSLLAEYHDIFSSGTQWAWLYSFNWTCDQSHQWCPCLRSMIQADSPYYWWKKSDTDLREMLDSGAIHPSQNAWCNAVVLVQKEGWESTFLHRHPPSQHPHKARIPTHCQEFKRCLRCLVGAQAISHAWTWSLDSGRSRWMSCQNSTLLLLSLQPRLLWVQVHAFWAVQCTSHISQVNAKLPSGS